jgi:hypothetical protein
MDTAVFMQMAADVVKASSHIYPAVYEASEGMGAAGGFFRQNGYIYCSNSATWQEEQGK